MLQPFSQTELALRDTLLTKAVEEMFDDLVRMYGIERPPVFGIPYWRKGALGVVWGPRGTFGNMHVWLESILDAVGSDLVFTATLDPAHPTKLGFVSGPDPAVDDFSCEHSGRLIRIISSLTPPEGLLYYSTGPGAPTNLIELCDVETSYWSAADWSGLDGTEQVQIKILPFTVEEPSPGPESKYGRRCWYQVYLDGALFFVPPTYLLEDGTKDRTVINSDMPYGGALMDQYAESADYWDDLNVIGDPADAIDGNNFVPMPPPNDTKPYPIYLGDDTAPAIHELLDRLLASGVTGRIAAVDYCDAKTFIDWSKK